MAQLKETQITDRRFTLSVDDDDLTKVVAMLSATTRTNDGQVVVAYQQDVTDELGPADLQVLLPLLERGQRRIMTERGITEADLREGGTVRIQQRQAMEEIEAERQARFEQMRQDEQTRLNEFAVRARAEAQEVGGLVNVDQEEREPVNAGGGPEAPAAGG